MNFPIAHSSQPSERFDLVLRGNHGDEELSHLTRTRAMWSRVRRRRGGTRVRPSTDLILRTGTCGTATAWCANE